MLYFSEKLIYFVYCVYLCGIKKQKDYGRKTSLLFLTNLNWKLNSRLLTR